MADSDYTDDELAYEGPSSQSVIWDALWTPFRVLFSKTALRIYLNTLLFIGATIFIVGIAGIAYMLFYFTFIPTVGVDREVHLQFGDGHPWGLASLDSEFVSSQPYDIAVALDLPRTPSNLDAGNFMVDLTLYSRRTSSVLPTSSGSLTPISQSRRSAILTYSSPLVDVARRMARLPLYVLGWRREAEFLEVPMMDKLEFARGAQNLPQSLRLEIHSDTKLQIYSARVEFRARFTGLRWFMYRWKLTSFVVFSSLFWTVSMSTASLIWFVLSSLKPESTSTDEIKDEEQDLIKDEPVTEESESLFSESFKIKKEQPEEQASSSSLLQSYKADSDEGGMGSGLESSEAQGVQKRRSRLTEYDS
ncbi:uncharacterized protein N7483_001374 [Penicillium malachiteum]|uniref:uncharacterized protein n=1 Tax=Penicillium malachiteum TaxID=1324776 RepID=UPI002546BD5B|nr:uncharacterized protein N7483_001374 [Penicillium malachiteum]KAJ5736249.1 hypothetical protein N7483_001374 [Penicillium malachiteum]